MNRDDENPPRNQPDSSGAGTAGGGAGAGNRGGGDDDDDQRHHGRRHHRHHYYHQDDTQLYGTSGVSARSQGGGRTQGNKQQDECDRGYEDGLKAGEKDARRGLSSDPQRSSLYRNGGETVNRVGRTAAAKQAYRDCFLHGYEESYRSVQPNPVSASPRN